MLLKAFEGLTAEEGEIAPPRLRPVTAPWSVQVNQRRRAVEREVGAFEWAQSSQFQYAPSSRIDVLRSALSARLGAIDIDRRVGFALVAGLLVAMLVAAVASAAGNGAAKTVAAPPAAVVVSTPALEGARGNYNSYIDEQAGILVQRTAALSNAISVGDVAAAQAAYKEARVPYERMWPVASSFEGLHAEITAPEFSSTPDNWGGFHRIEKGLFQAGSTDGLAPAAVELLANVKALQVGLSSADLDTEALAEGAAESLNQASQFNLYGEEDRYSGTDLSDAQATLDASKAAYDAVAPAVSDKEFQAVVEARFAAANAALAPMKSESGFADYRSVGPEQLRSVTYSLDNLGEAMAKLPAKVK